MGFGKPVYRTSSNQSNSSQKSKDKRSSNGSTLSRKRFLSFLGSNGHGHGHGNSSSKDSSPDHNHTQPHSQQYHHSQMASPTTPTSQINLPPPNLHLHPASTITTPSTFIIIIISNFPTRRYI